MVRVTNHGSDQLLLLDAKDAGELRDRVADSLHRLREPASGGLEGVAAALARGLRLLPFRAAVLASSPEQAQQRLAALARRLGDGDVPAFEAGDGVFAGRAGEPPAIGFLFPGQGADVGAAGAALTRRFPQAGGAPGSDGSYQQQIVASSLVGLRVLSLLGIEAAVATGHSLGELTALHWAGAMSEPELLTLVAAHSRILGRAARPGGLMARIDAGPDRVETLLGGEPVVVAGYNAPGQTVVAGPADATDRVLQAAVAAGLPAGRLPVPVAFHTRAMAPAEDGLRAHLADAAFRPLHRRVLSTVTGAPLPPDADLPALLVRQVCEPVRFSQALGRMAGEVRLLVEVGPDRLLSKLAALACPEVPVVPLGTDSPDTAGVLRVAAAAYVLGAPVRTDLLVAGPVRQQGGTRR